ncbi:PKD domain-containing protein [Kitasatospora sp. NPDC002227]|uniref:PKD domain-containing protein n=1 Tax=Kitasatospora sp. NPDC002227 TaxID=3154773 RepID=UPI0033276B2A
MRRRRRLAAAIVVASTGLVSAMATLPAAAVADAATLYVDDSVAGCSDSGPGSQAQPFCTVQAGADAAHAGQTVAVAMGKGQYAEQVTLHNSGAPGKPIVIKGVPTRGDSPYVGVFAYYGKPETARAFVLDHVHDVTVQGFALGDTAAEAVLVKDSSGITLDSNEVDGAGWGNFAPQGQQPTVPGGNPVIRLTGASSDITVSRNRIGGGNGGGIAVDAGVTGAVLTTNAVTANGRAMTGKGAGISVTGAPHTVITSNTVASSGAAGIVLTGGSHDATVENNVVADSYSRLDKEPTATEFSVSADSTPGTTADYNTLYPTGMGSAYTWGPDSYQQPADFATATGQGAHDLREAPKFLLDGAMNSSVVPTAASGSTDSANASAPGELTTDLFGKPRVDDPQAANGANGFHDRGAAELQAYSRLDLGVDFGKGPRPLTVTVTATAAQNWPDTTTYTYDFGDNSTPLVTTDAKVQHQYLTNGEFHVTVTANGTGANTGISASAGPISVVDPADLVADLRIAPAPRQEGYGPLGYAFDLSHSTSSYYLTDYRIDFGDGTSSPYSYQTRHTYQQPGDYTVTATVKDQGGRTATAKQVVHVAYTQLGFTPTTPTRLLDTRSASRIGGFQRLGPGQSATVYIPTQAGHPHADAAVLNVTAVNPNSGGYLSVYPAGNDRPATSNVNFKAGQTVPNLVTVPTGGSDAVTVYNFSGDTDLVVDLLGVYEAGDGSKFTALAPSRLLDTRKSAAVGPDASTSIQVRGAAGVPADATAVVLNLTSTASDAGGFLTAYPSGTTRPGTSNLNFTAGQTVANQVIVPIGADGKVSVYNRFGHTHVVADVFGYYSPTGSLLTPVVPTRLVDTRKQTALGQGGTLKVNTGVPAGATGAVLNVTSTASTAGGYLTVWADGATKPGTSNVNFPAGGTVPNHVTTPLGTNGAFDVYNFAGSTQVVADLFGYFSK